MSRYEVLGDLDQRHLGRVHLKVFEEHAGQPFVDQNAPMLRIIDEFNDIVTVIFALNQVRLRASAHFTYQVAGADRHASRERAGALVCW